MRRLPPIKTVVTLHAQLLLSTVLVVPAIAIAGPPTTQDIYALIQITSTQLNALLTRAEMLCVMMLVSAAAISVTIERLLKDFSVLPVRLYSYYQLQAKKE